MNYLKGHSTRMLRTTSVEVNFERLAFLLGQQRAVLPYRYTSVPEGMGWRGGEEG